MFGGGGMKAGDLVMWKYNGALNPEKIAEYEAYSNPGRDWYIPPSEEEIALDLKRSKQNENT